MESTGLVVLLALLGVCAARFTSDLQNMMQGDNVLLTWEVDDPKYYPLFIQATVFSAADSSAVNMLRTNITSNVASASYNWTKVPYPLAFFKSGQYQLVIRPQTWDETKQGPAPTIAKSDLFTILPSADPNPTTQTTNQPGFGPAPSLTPAPNHSYSKTIAIAVCVGVGIPALIGIGVAVWCVRRRREAALKERRRRRFEMVIH